MICNQMKDLVHAYLDDELSLTEQVSFEQHLSACPECQQAHQSFSRLRQNLRQGGLQFPLPSGFKLNVPSDSFSRVSPAPRFRYARYLAIAAMILLAFASGSMWHFSQDRSSLLRALADAHVRSLQANHLLDVVSTDQHTVKPWFEGKIDFGPPVRDLAADGFPLVGGRLDYLQNRTTAVLVYGHGKHQINLFIWPEQGADEAIHDASVDGFQIVSWRSAGLRRAAVSDMNVDDMNRLADLLSH